jgi:hypothetical protein
MRKHEIEEVEDGVWIHTERPDGEEYSIFVNINGSSDGVIVELWNEIDCISHAGWEWSEMRQEGEET